MIIYCIYKPKIKLENFVPSFMPDVFLSHRKTLNQNILKFTKNFLQLASEDFKMGEYEE